MTARRRSRILWSLAATYWCLIFTLTHIPPRHLPHVHLKDKYQHVLAYGGLGGALFIALGSSHPKIVQLGIVVLAICMAYGAFDEKTQPLFGRDCDMGDWIADTCGAAIAAV